MKTCTRNLLIIILLAVALAVIMSVLYAVGLIEIYRYDSINSLALMTVGAVTLLGMLTAGVTGCQAKALKDAFCCCGKAAVIGAAGLIAAAFFSSLLNNGRSALAAYILLSVTVFFLIFTVGSVCCFVTAYHQCGERPCGRDSHRYVAEPTRRDEKADYPYMDIPQPLYAEKPHYMEDPAQPYAGQNCHCKNNTSHYGASARPY